MARICFSDSGSVSVVRSMRSSAASVRALGGRRPASVWIATCEPVSRAYRRSRLSRSPNGASMIVCNRHAAAVALSPRRSAWRRIVESRDARSLVLCKADCISWST